MKRPNLHTCIESISPSNQLAKIESTDDEIMDHLCFLLLHLTGNKIEQTATTMEVCTTSQQPCIFLKVVLPFNICIILVIFILLSGHWTFTG